MQRSRISAGSIWLQELVVFALGANLHLHYRKETAQAVPPPQPSVTPKAPLSSRRGYIPLGSAGRRFRSLRRFAQSSPADRKLRRRSRASRTSSSCNHTVYTMPFLQVLPQPLEKVRTRASKCAPCPALCTDISISTLAAVLGAERTTSTHRATARQRVVADRADLPTLAIRIQQQMHLALCADLSRSTKPERMILGAEASCANENSYSSSEVASAESQVLQVSSHRAQIAPISPVMLG